MSQLDPTDHDVADEQTLKRIVDRNPSRLGVGRSGARPRTETLLTFLEDHGRARDAVLTTVDEQLIDDLGLVKIRSLSMIKTSISPGQISGATSPRRPQLNSVIAANRTLRYRSS